MHINFLTKIYEPLSGTSSCYLHSANEFKLIFDLFDLFGLGICYCLLYIPHIPHYPTSSRVHYARAIMQHSLWYPSNTRDR